MGCMICGSNYCSGGLTCRTYRQLAAQQMQLTQANALRNAVAAHWTGGLGIQAIPISPTLDPALRKPLPSGGMKVEDLIGWRVWRVRNDHLWSYSADYAWMPGDVSEGDPGDHDSAGVWAFKDKRRAFQKAVEEGRGLVWGSVRLWGHVVEHKDGFRASKARIISIDGATRDVIPETLIDLCRLYRVPETEVPPAPVRKPPVPLPQYVTAPSVVPFGELPPLDIESKPDTPWPVIWIVGGILLACAAMPMLRP